MKKILSLTLALVMLMSALFIMSSCDKKEDEKDVLVCGVTIFENMNEKDANGNLQIKQFVEKPTYTDEAPDPNDFVNLLLCSLLDNITE